MSCLVRFLSSISLFCSCGGMYIEQIVIVLCSVTCVATAWSFDFMGSWLCGMSFLTIVAPMSCIMDVVILFIV